MKTFSAIYRDKPGIVKIRARSMRAAIAEAMRIGADRVFQGGLGLDSGWLK